MEVDHIVPRSKKGKDVYSNLQLLHTHCHHIKTAIDNREEPDEPKGSRPVL